MGWIWKLVGAALGLWVVFMVAGAVFATLKTFVIVGLVAAALYVVVSLVARRRRSDRDRNRSAA
jgi:hypothetical protein